MSALHIKRPSAVKSAIHRYLPLRKWPNSIDHLLSASAQMRSIKSLTVTVTVPVMAPPYRSRSHVHAISVMQQIFPLGAVIFGFVNGSAPLPRGLLPICWRSGKCKQHQPDLYQPNHGGIGSLLNKGGEVSRLHSITLSTAMNNFRGTIRSHLCSGSQRVVHSIVLSFSEPCTRAVSNPVARVRHFPSCVPTVASVTGLRHPSDSRRSD
jgi:hypothetical protein